ncbi:hypothetical protein PMZ80_007385 [Knufia obscura]|uniref:Uncharacterized protein n=1 Tax=Knufia obscura TaxID=1635080 RepID=A0ABR0RI95_9EURO|nr:hypothetical protein PMZ80_007385 [Knufia obscura]
MLWYEAVWYFVGCAVLLGAVSALLLHGIFRIVVLIFRLDREPEPKPKDVPARGHDVKSYRKTRERKREQAEKEQAEIDARAQALANSPLLKEALKQISGDPVEDINSPNRRKSRPSLLDQPIIENSDEEDS